MTNSAAIADALIAHSRGILTKPQKESADTLTFAVPHVMTQEAYRALAGAKPQGAK